jgi:type II secretory pathway pseudopilin PulG
MEALVGVGVIGVLLSLLIPGLSGARRRSMETASLGRLSQIGQTIAQYNAAHQDAYPQSEIGATYWDTRGRVPIASRGYPLSTYAQWCYVVSDAAPLAEFAASWIGPAESLDPEPTTSFLPSYLQCNTFAASPSLWTDRGRAEAPLNKQPFFSPVRTGMVAYPALKIMFHDATVSYDRRPIRAWHHSMPDRPTPALGADSHAEVVIPSATTVPFQCPLPTSVGQYPWHNTPNGVLGRDLTGR